MWAFMRLIAGRYSNSLQLIVSNARQVAQPVNLSAGAPDLTDDANYVMECIKREAALGRIAARRTTGAMPCANALHRNRVSELGGGAFNYRLVVPEVLAARPAGCNCRFRA